MADRATQGRPKNPAKSTLLQCCASNRGRGGRQLTMPLAGPAAPRPRARGTRPLELSLGDRRSLDRAHVDISADLGWCHRQRVSRQFFEVSIAAASYLGNDQSRSASKGTKAEGRWQPNAPRRKPNAATRSYSRNRSRRASQVAARPGEGPSTEPTPAIRPRPRERVFM